MDGHGKHCNCMMCSMGKSVGLIKKCEDGSCEHPSHKKEAEDTQPSESSE